MASRLRLSVLIAQVALRLFSELAEELEGLGELAVRIGELRGRLDSLYPNGEFVVVVPCLSQRYPALAAYGAALVDVGSWERDR